MAEEPSYKRKRVAIDRAQAQRRHDARPFDPPSAGRAAPAPCAHGGPGGRDEGRFRYRSPEGAPRRTRIPYAEHGQPRPARARAATAQHARHAQGRQAVAFHDEPPHRARGRQQAPAPARNGGRWGNPGPHRPRSASLPSQEIVVQTPPMGGSARVLNPNAPLLPAWAKLLLMLVALIALLWAGSKLLSCVAQAPDAEPEPEAPAISTSRLVEDRLASYAPCDSLEPTDLDALSGGVETTGFALSGQQGANEPTLSEERRTALAAALEPFTEDGFNVGFVLMDIGTGRGFARNVDEPIYGASSFKGPYCTFVAESYVDSDEVAMSEVSDSFYNAIVHSDNSTYDAMRARFSDSRLAGWLDGLGIDDEVARDTYYPTYTTRDSAKLWLNAYRYLEGNGAAADQLRADFAQTKTSFMRTAVTDAPDDAEGGQEAAELAAGEGGEDAEGGQIAVAEAATLGDSVSDVLVKVVEEASADDVTVYDKAGWYPRDADNIPSIVDAGIVSCNGRDYLLCVMTDMPWSEPNQRTAEALIDAIFATREDLG